MISNLIYKPRRKAVSLTPLIDVVFILLMFFMLTSSFTREKQLELASPVASSNALANTARQLLLQQNGELAIMNKDLLAFTEKALTDKAITNEFASDQALVIRPAPDVNVQTMVSALARLKALGFNQLSLGNPFADPVQGLQQ